MGGYPCRVQLPIRSRTTVGRVCARLETTTQIAIVQAQEAYMDVTMTPFGQAPSRLGTMLIGCSCGGFFELHGNGFEFTAPPQPRLG
mmetsp:Transcript_86266/g.150355  ORF Transcript_86266/g.150355 Transcript_86266/m.150355 type:complete len:87 (-) Transcript_86266:239-499(-)